MPSGRSVQAAPTITLAAQTHTQHAQTLDRRRQTP